MYEKLSAAAQYIQGVRHFVPKVGMVLGSGLGTFVESVQKASMIPYSEIPFFSETTVEGHQGRLNPRPYWGDSHRHFARPATSLRRP